ncbi:hypothetical protein VTN00DRAFT_3292 [Thermoascus crustaceus]|uniref:uncharacterized protein n=1 Tax=Thermoascus crustaceus TaxID=5088 RepID=UPI003744339A
MGFGVPYFPAWHGKTLVYMITFCCSAGFILFGMWSLFIGRNALSDKKPFAGYDQGVMAGIIGAKNQFGKDFDHPSAGLQGTILAVYEVGACTGSLLTIFFGDLLGRRRTILVGTLIQVIGTIIQITSWNIPQIIVGRVVTGVGVGALTSTIPTYQSETCSPKDRGKVLAIDCTVTLIGVVVAYWIDYGFAHVNGPAQWRFPVGLQLVFSVVTVALLLFLPETPRWLAKHGNQEESRAVIARLAENDIPLDHPDVMKLYNSIQDALSLESAGGSFKYRELFTGDQLQNYRRMLLCLAVDGFSQLSGINLITYYAPVIFESIGLSRDISLLVAGFNAVEYLLASMIPIWIIDKVGRRQLMITGCTGQAFCMMVLAITVQNGSQAAGYVACVCLFLFNTFFSWGWLTSPWLYAPEVCTLRIRQKGAAAASASFWICNFIVVEITPICFSTIGWKTYLLFMSTNAAIIPIVFLFFPETTGMPLECADHLFEGKGFTRGAHRGKKHVREVIERFNNARPDQTSTTENFEDSADKKSVRR